MTSITAAAGGGNWTAGGTWVGGIAPTAADDALLTSASGNVTIDTGAVCRSLDCSTYLGVLTHTAGVTLTIGDATAGVGNRALRLVAGMTYTLGSSSTSAISFVSTSVTVQTITSGTKVCGNTTYNGSTGSWQFADAFSAAGNGSITVTAGTLDTNSQTVACRNFNSTNSNTRSITLGTSTFTISGNGNPWDFTNTTGLTFSGASSIINAAYSNGTFIGGGKTFGTLTITQNNAGSTSISGANTFGTLTVNGVNNTDIVAITDNLTVTGTFTATGGGATNVPSLRSFVIGTPVTITAAVVSLTNFLFCDIVGAGAATWSGTGLGDLGGNSGITFATPVTRYWVATSGGNFAATSSWSTSTGGASGASIPLPQDTVVFDALSITSGARTITLNQQVIPTLDFTNILNSPTLAITLSNGNIYANGDLKLISGMTVSGTSGLLLSGRGAQTITSGGVTITNPITIIAFGGSYTLQDAMVVSNTVTVTNGTFNANNLALTCTRFNSSSSLARTVSMGTNTWTLSGTGTVWDLSTSTGLTFTPSTSTIKLTDTSATQKTFSGGGKTYNNIWITGAGTGTYTIVGSNTFADFKVDTPPHTINMTAGTTTTFDTLTASGTAGNLVTFQSSSAGTAWNFSKATGVITLDYLSLKDSHALGGANFYAGANSTNVSGNTGWQFFAYQSPAAMGFFLVTI